VGVGLGGGLAADRLGDAVDFGVLLGVGLAAADGVPMNAARPSAPAAASPPSFTALTRIPLPSCRPAGIPKKAA
jgi:hypothetical protein